MLTEAVLAPRGNTHSQPSTIVGSAAFNLLVILAVCVTALPNGDTRVIEDQFVFGMTAISSVFAYLWCGASQY